MRRTAMFFITALVLTRVEISAAQSERQKPLTIEDAVRRALSANRSIADAADNVTRSSYSLSAAKSDFDLKIFPSVNGVGGQGGYGAGVVLNQKIPLGTQITAIPRFLKGETTWNSGLDLTVTQSLTKGLSPSYNLAAIRESEFQVRQAERQLSLTKNQVILQTISAMYAIVRARETVTLQQASYDRLMSYHQAALLKQKIGLASGIDVYRARISARQAESSLLISREGYRDALDNLGLILNLPMDENTDVQAPLDTAAFDIEEPQAIATALAHRPEMRQQEDAVSMTAFEASVAKRNLLPDLDLFARYSLQGADTSLRRSLASAQGQFSIGLNVSGDIRKPAERAEYESRQLAIRHADRAQFLTRDQITLEIRSALRNKLRAEKDIGLQEEQVRQVNGKLELAKVKFAHGMANNFDVIESEAELRAAEIGLVSARIDAIIARYALKLAMGILLSGDGRIVN